MGRVTGSSMSFLKVPHKPTTSVTNGSSTTGAASFESDFFEVRADVQLAASKSGESGHGLRLGFTQLQRIETNRAIYRGLSRSDGGVFVKKDRPPSRPAQICRDVNSMSDAFTYASGTTKLIGYTAQHSLNLKPDHINLPATMTPSLVDGPADYFPAQQHNHVTGKINDLHWAQLEFHFCTVLIYDVLTALITS